MFSVRSRSRPLWSWLTWPRSCTWFSSTYRSIPLHRVLRACSWILYLAQNSNDTIYKKAMYYGGFTFVTLPLPILIFRDLPRKMPPLFQLWFGIAVCVQLYLRP